VQARVAGAKLRILGSLSTPAEIEQSTVPLDYNGHPYVLLFTEAKIPWHVCIPGQPNFGFPRIVDVADETHPVQVSTMQSEVVAPENCKSVAADFNIYTRGLEKGSPLNVVLSSVFGYDAHYCTPDRLHNPTMIACAQLASGLRLYDVRDPLHPHEIAYYNTGTVAPNDPTIDLAVAHPVIRRDLGQVWWATIQKGFHVAALRGDG
jgi:hypothetical protein